MSRTGLPASHLRGNAFPTRLLVILFVACLHEAFSNSLRAANFCAENAAGLQAALDISETNGESDNIRVRTGVHSTADGYNYQQFGENFDLTLSGGWSANCVFPESRNPIATVLRRSSGEGFLFIAGLTDGDLHIENLSFADGNAPNARSVHIVTPTTGAPNISFERVAVFGTIAGIGLGISGGRFGELRIRNSLFYQNQNNTRSVRIDPPSSGVEVYFTNNTVISNSGGLLLADGVSTKALIANNIFWGNDPFSDLNIDGNGEVILENNNIGDLTGTPDVSVNNLSIDPLFEGSSFSPRFDSPMVDAGTKPPFFLPIPVPFEDDWLVGLKDFNYDEREQGPSVDIGAIESFPEIVFRDGYE